MTNVSAVAEVLNIDDAVLVPSRMTCLKETWKCSREMFGNWPDVGKCQGILQCLERWTPWPACYMFTFTLMRSAEEMVLVSGWYRWYMGTVQAWPLSELSMHVIADLSYIMTMWPWDGEIETLWSMPVLDHLYTCSILCVGWSIWQDFHPPIKLNKNFFLNF